MNINQITKKTKKAELKGWIHDYRDLGGLKFLQLRDSTGIIQVTIIKDKADPSILKAVQRLTKESVISITGTVQENPKVKSGLEVIPTQLTVHATSKPELPISITEKQITTGLSKRLDWRCLDLRKLKHQAIFRIQSALLQGMRDHLLDQDYTQVFTPCLMGVASESGSDVFPVIYFNREAFLRQDPQLHRQLSIAGGIQKVFDIGPCWRAEQSHTSKHLTEHRVIAVESGFIKDELDTMRLEEGMIVAALTNVKKKCKEELKTLNIEVTIPKTPFPELRFPYIYTLLEKAGKKIEHGEDLDSEAEKILWEYVQKKYKTEFYFINRFPFKAKPFYVMRVDDEPEHARSVDLYFKGLELSSGGQREHRYDKIMQAIKEKKMNASEVEWFTKFFEFGVPPHGGFAIGIERITQSLLNIENIRDCVLFPRDTDRIVP